MKKYTLKDAKYDIKMAYEIYKAEGLESVDDEFIHIIYKNGTELILSSNEEWQKPRYSEIVYVHYQNGFVDQDTETGKWNYDMMIDEDIEARDEYMTSIEIKYQTAWGMRQTA